MGVFRSQTGGPENAEAESRVGVATDANYPRQIPTIHLNSVACQKHRCARARAARPIRGRMTT